jgi:hypothetical protein
MLCIFWEGSWRDGVGAVVGIVVVVVVGIAVVAIVNGGISGWAQMKGSRGYMCMAPDLKWSPNGKGLGRVEEKAWTVRSNTRQLSLHRSELWNARSQPRSRKSGVCVGIVLGVAEFRSGLF